MIIFLNNSEETIPENCSLQQFLDSKNLGYHVLIEYNDEILEPEADFSAIILQPNDRINLFRIVAGG